MIYVLLLQWQVFFSPNGGAESAIVRSLDSAKTQVLVQAYSFTSEPIANAILRAYKRGCEVRVHLDKGQRKASGSKWLSMTANNIPVTFDRAKIQHSKVILIDSQKVITGSYNFTKSAEKSNKENLLVIQDRKLALLYIQEFNDIAK